MLMGTLICSFAGLRTRVNEPVGQVDTHSPQPAVRVAARRELYPEVGGFYIWVVHEFL